MKIKIIFENGEKFSEQALMRIAARFVRIREIHMAEGGRCEYTDADGNEWSVENLKKSRKRH